MGCYQEKDVYMNEKGGNNFGLQIKEKEQVTTTNKFSFFIIESLDIKLPIAN